MPPRSPCPEQTTRYQPLMVVLAAVCGGILVDRTAALPWTCWAAVALGCLAAWTLLVWRQHDRTAAIVLLLAIASTAGTWHHLRWSRFRPDDLGFFAAVEPAPVCVEVIALKGPRRVAPPPFDPMRVVPIGERTRLLVRATAIRDGSRWRPTSGRTTLTVDGQLIGVEAGDRLRVFGTLSRPHRAHNPGGFEQADFLRGSRQLCRLWTSYPDCVWVVEPARVHGLRWWIERVRTDARRTLWRELPTERAELASAVLLGARAEVDPEQTNTFVETGAVHLLAISGLHVGIVAGVLILVLRVLPVSRTSAFWIVLGWTVAYTLLTDARPPAIRATILVAVLCYARVKRRPVSPWNTLAAAGLFVLALNPADLFNTGVHLSFLAVATLIRVSPRWFAVARSDDPLDRLLERARGPGERLVRWLGVKFVRVAVPCAAVWLVTLPLVAARFHVVATGAVLLNVLLWIPMTVAIVAGFLTILSAWILPPVMPAFALVCNGSLLVLQAMIDGAHHMPGNPLWSSGPPDWWLLGFYSLLAAAVWSVGSGYSRRVVWGVVASWVVIGLVAGHRFASEERLVCTVISVGHGSAVVLEMPGGPVMLYDAGRLASPATGARAIAGCLWAKGIDRLDAIVLSHADADHFNAVPELLRRFPVDTIYVAPGMFEGSRRSVRELKDSIDDHEVPIRNVLAGDRFRVGGATVEVLHPPEASFGGHDNAASIVLSVEFAGRGIILPGDVDDSGLEALLQRDRRPCDILVAPHHGSRRTDAPGLIDWCSPRCVVISGHRDWRTESVAQVYRDFGAAVLYTGDVGAVTVTVEADEVRVKTHLEE